MTTPSQPDPMMGGIAGAADLQSSVDRLDTDIKGLTIAVQGMSNGNGTHTSTAMSSTYASQGVTFTNGSQGTSYGAGLGGFGFGGGGMFGGGGGGGGGSGGSGGTNPYSMGQGIANAATSVINGQFLLGAQQLNDQAIINTYGYTQAGFWNASSKSAIGTAFGRGAGAGMTTNNLAFSAADARMGGGLLSQISGQANYTAGAGPVYGRGNAPFQAAAGIGMANPGLGMTGAATTSGAWYNAGTSYNLMMMGVASTPLQLGTGKANNMNSVQAAIGQRFGFQGFNSKTGTFNSDNLAANLNNPLFQMQIMQATGMNQQEYNQWSQSWAQQNNWALKGHTTMNQMQSEIAQYMNGGTGDQQKSAAKWLQSHGVSMSLLQSMQSAQAAQTGTEAGGNADFTKGVQTAATAITALTKSFSTAIELMGGTSGFAGAVGSLNASGVSGAGAAGTANTVIAAIAGTISGVNNLNSSLAKQVAKLNAGVNLDLATMASVAAGGTGTSAPGGNNPSGGTGTKGNPGGTSIGSTESGHQGSVTNTGNDFTSKVNGASPSGYGSAASKWYGYATSLFPQHGWSSSQWPYLAALWQAESGWNPNAYNASGATGIPQALPGSKMASAGPDWRTNGNTQIRWGESYISQVYGTPQKAWDHEVIHGWYADGTSSARPGLAMVGERGPELVSLSGGQSIMSASKMAAMMQPAFSGAGNLVRNSMGSGGGVVVLFQKGAVTISGGSISGYHTSGDVQSSAAQLTQAIETSLQKSAVLRKIASGVV